MATYRIKNADGKVVNTIIADAAFVEAHFPGLHQEVLPTAAEIAAQQAEGRKAQLVAIDSDTGMSRALRETLIEICTALSLPASHLRAREAEAVALRASLAR